MVHESSDLQHRRPKHAAKATGRRRSSAGGDGMTSSSRRRKRRPENPTQITALIAGLVLAATIIPIVLIVRSSLRGGGGPNGGGGSSSPSSWEGRFLQNPKSINKPDANSNGGSSSSGVVDIEAEERAKKREERYASLYKPKFDESALGYNIYDCPHDPPKGYPKAWRTTELLGSWNPNDVTTLPPAHREVYQGLCVFDHQTQYKKALNYRNLEKPFVIRNDPKVTTVARRWEDDPEYLHRALGDVDQFRTERSPNNQFTWYRLRGNRHVPERYVRPANDEIEMTFGEWLEHALEKDGKALGDADVMTKAQILRERRLGLMNGTPGEEEGHEDDSLEGVDDTDQDGGKDEESEESKRKKYYYFRLNADLRAAREASPSRFIYDELPFLDPRKRRDSQFYIVDPAEERGINCRFGMRGVTATNHFDMSRNTIAIFGGERRYILASPSQCNKMALYPKGHPSLRHSSLDWSNPAEWDEHPEFKGALVNEVVLHAGDVLYLPTSWFHYIVNLSLNYQCNARSGTTYENAHHIEDCGFPMK